MPEFRRAPDWDQRADRATRLTDPVVTVRQLSRFGFARRPLTRIDHALVRRMRAIDHAATEQVNTERRGREHDAAIDRRVREQDALQWGRATEFEELQHELRLQQQKRQHTEAVDRARRQMELQQVNAEKISFYRGADPEPPPGYGSAPLRPAGATLSAGAKDVCEDTVAEATGTADRDGTSDAAEAAHRPTTSDTPRATGVARAPGQEDHIT